MDRTDSRDPDCSRRRRAALAAALWTGLLFASIPMVRTVQRWLLAQGLERWITPAVVGAVLMAVVVAAIRLFRSTGRPLVADAAWLSVVAVVAAGWAWHLRRRPEEAVHLLEYGVLCWLIYRALRPVEPDAAVLVSAALLGTIMGTVDEIIQWITPARFWDFRDVGLNAGACALGAVVSWRLDRGRWRPPAAGSVRLTLRLGAALAVLITLCLANTPARVAWYSARVPGLGFLAHPANEMAEYGYLHRLPGVGTFKSRLTMEELAEQDRRRAAEAAAIIDRYPDVAYRRFQWDHQGFADPLTYEARVHVFSRDNKMRLARRAASDADERKLRSPIAYRENQILERVFTYTVGHSLHGLPPKPRRELEELHDPDRPFVSRVGTHLITWTSEPALRAALLLLALLLVLLDRAVGQGRRRSVEAQP